MRFVDALLVEAGGDGVPTGFGRVVTVPRFVQVSQKVFGTRSAKVVNADFLYRERCWEAFPTGERFAFVGSCLIAVDAAVVRINPLLQALRVLPPVVVGIGDILVSFGVSAHGSIEI